MFREKGLSYNAGFDDLGDGVYLKGYWQSERYFKSVETAIRDDFRIVTPPLPENAAILTELAQMPAISLHIRRGDYVSNSRTNATHGTCTLDYYARAVELIAGKMAEKPVIFTFSDDPAWVRENLTLPHEMRVMEHNDSDHNYEDLRLMSACRHHIIANSSFSWWGAWLNPRRRTSAVARSGFRSDRLPPRRLACQTDDRSCCALCLLASRWHTVSLRVSGCR